MQASSIVRTGKKALFHPCSTTNDSKSIYKCRWRANLRVRD